MGFSKNKYIEKLKNQEKANGKTSERGAYWTTRSTVFKSKKDYNRQKEKLALKNGDYDID